MLDGIAGWSLSDRLALAGLILSFVLAVAALVWRSIGRMVHAMLRWGGRLERRYAAKFIAKWGAYENPYLADIENLDLSSTFVSLSFHAPDGGHEERRVATSILADRDGGNLIIEGSPGSGKSTLLRAYGVGILKRESPFIRRRIRLDIPFFVQLRKFAKYAGDPQALARYIVDQLLVPDTALTPADATEFLRTALDSGRALVMLDGLDEVTSDRYEAVFEAVYKFSRDESPDCPTHRARLIITCRRQNFLAIRDDWVPLIARNVCVLAPLRNSEIFSYLDKLRSKFRSAGGPESYFNAVRASGTFDLHRVPLVLAMSVGLYARKEYFDIPNSITRLYQTMIEEMLDRQRFRRDPGGSALRFRMSDKYRFLREFAFEAARGPVGLNDFGIEELVRSARALARRLDEVDDPDGFIDEIVERSGLLSDVSESGRYVFAHRSIHEHLAAEELRLLADETVILDHAVDAEWRQIIIFYAAPLEQRAADRFLERLAIRNVALAAQCLAATRASDEVARSILDELRTSDPVHLAALVAASTSPRRPVQEMAVQRVEQHLLTSLNAVLAAFSGDVGGMLALLSSLAGSNTARIASFVPLIAGRIPDDPRLVEPLWRCLAAPGIQDQPACRDIVERLLTIAMEPDGVDELRRQEPYARDFLTSEVRNRGYPFSRALPPTDNVVTLLAWAEYLNVVPANPNRYFEAKAAGRLAMLEVDKRRTLSVSLFWPGRILSSAFIAATIIAIIYLVADWSRMLHPFGWWTPLVGLLGGLATVGAIFGLALLSDRWPSRFNTFLGSSGTNGDTGNVITLLPQGTFTDVVEFGIPTVYAVVVPPVVPWQPWGFIVSATLVPFFVYWLPSLDGFDRATRFNLYRPSAYVDVYDEPRSRLWLRSEPQRTPIQRQPAGAATRTRI